MRWIERCESRKMGLFDFSAAMIILLQVGGALFVSQEKKPTTEKKHRKEHRRPHAHAADAASSDSSSWASFRRLINCKYDAVDAQEPKKKVTTGSYEKMVRHASSLCSIKDETKDANKHKGHTEEVQVAVGKEKKVEKVSRNGRRNRTATAKASGCARGRRWSACSECRLMNTMLGGPVPMSSAKVCPCCSQNFASAGELAHHHSSVHTVSELSEDDSAKNVVEIIFKTSWLKAEERLVSIEKILKIHNTQSTLDRFEEYREMIKARAKRHPDGGTRCVADGNELLRFRCVSVACSLGDSTLSLCSLRSCHACHVITHGFSSAEPLPLPLPLAPRQQESLVSGVCTTAGSGTAHDWMTSTSAKTDGQRRAMLVCRVIAGRVHRSPDLNASEGVGVVDSVSRTWPSRSRWDEATENSRLYMGDDIMACSARAVLPCFVVFYHTSSPRSGTAAE